MLKITKGKLRVFISYLNDMKIVSMFYISSFSTFYSLFLPFFALEIFKACVCYFSLFLKDKMYFSISLNEVH